MRINTICNSKEKTVTMLMSLLQFSRKIPKLPGRGGGVNANSGRRVGSA